MATTSPAPSPDAPAAALTPARAAALLRKDKRLSGALPLPGWLLVLQTLGAEDKKGDSLRGWLGGLAIGAAILAFILLVTEAFVAAGAVAILFVGLLVGYILQRRTDLADHLRQFIVPLLRVLSQDVAPDAPVELTLHLTDRFDKSHRKQKVGGVELFEYPWLAGKARLLDGSTLDFAIVDEARRWSVSKRGRSGKTKVKTKLVVRSDVTVRLGALKGAYEPRPAQGATPFHVKTTEKRHVITAERSIKRKGLGGADLQLKDFLGVIAQAYGALAPTAGHQKGGA
jgi:hypothetical protein